MNISKTKSLQFRVNVTFIAIVVVLAVIFNFYTYFRDRSNRIESLNETAVFTTERLSQNFAAPIWDMEIDKLTDLIRFELGDKQLYAIIVKDAANSKVLTRAMRNANWEIVTDDPAFSSNVIKTSKAIERENQAIGHVETYFSTRFLNEELNWSLLSSTLMFAILAAILIFSIYFLLHNIVIKPVQSVVALTKKLNDGDLSARLQAGEDEIGQMITAINDFATNLQKAIKYINQSMKAVANGKLTEQITVNLKGDLNELKSSINNSIVLLGQTIGQVAQSSEKVKAGSSEISISASSLANGASQQAASIEEMTSAINQFSSQTKANNDNAAQALQLSNQTLEIVKKGNTQMENMLTSITEINNTSLEVSKVIKVIDAIASQTNLLALNAAVEAARAGKYGKGFAVVADEVRNLASRSAEAAKNTTALIEAAIAEVGKGVTNADLTAAALNEISASIEKTNDLIGEISSASKEQAIGIDEINKGLAQVNEIVQQNSSISEETASSSAILSSQAVELQNLMGQFVLTSQQKNDQFQPRFKPTLEKPPVKPALPMAPQKKQPPVLKLPLDDDEINEPQKTDEIKAKPMFTPAKGQKIIVLDDQDFKRY